MIDKLVMTSKNTLTVLYTNRPAFHIYSDIQCPIVLLHWLTTETTIEAQNYAEALTSSEEVTQPIKVAA